MSSLNLLLATMRADGSLPKNPCAKIDKLERAEKGAREKRVKVEKAAKKQRSKAIQKLTTKVKREVAEIDATYGKPGKPSKCSPAKKASRKARVADSPELRRGTKMEQKEHGHSKVDARQIAADHLAKDPHAYDPKPRAKPAKATKAKATKAKAKKVAKAATKKTRAKKVAAVTKAARAGQQEVDAFEEKVVKAVKADAKKAKAAIKREGAAARKKIREEAAAAKREAKKQAKAAAHRPVAAATKPPKKEKVARAAKPKAERPAKAPTKQPRAKKAGMRPVLPQPRAREEVFVADAPAANDAVDAKKDAAAMAGFEAMIARQMAKLQGGTVESMPASKKPRTGNTYVWDDDGSFSESDIEVLGDRAFTGAKYTGQLAAEGSMFDTWKLRDGRNIAQTAFDAPRRAARY